MMKFSPVKSLAFAAAALLATSAWSAVMAQNANFDPGNTQAGSFSGQNQPSSPWPVYGEVYDGQYAAAAGSGNGAGFVAAGTNSQGQYHTVGVTTQVPGTACGSLSGTDVNYDCDAW